MENKTIPQMFRDSVKKFQNLAAVVEEDGGDKWSYKELAEAVDKAGRALISMGLKPKDRVSIWAPNGVEWIIAALGIQSGGGVVVPLNTRFKGKEAGYVLKKSGARFLFCIGNFLDVNYLEMLGTTTQEQKQAQKQELKSLEQIVVLGEESGTALEGTQSYLSWAEFLKLGEPSKTSDAQELENRIAAGSPEDLSDISFTSGTTGLPKGVMTTHSQSLRGYASWSESVGLKQGDRYLIVNPFFHSFGYKAGWLSAFMMGATVFPKAVFDPVQAMLAVQEFKITFLPGPPTLYQSILNHPDFGKFDMSSLRVAVTGAAAIPVELILEMTQRLTFENILTGYGLTESSGIATMCRVGDDAETIATTSGRAIPNVEVMVVDDQGQPVPSGEPGEVWIRGYNVTQGYLDDPKATKESIDAEGWLHSGDIGVMNEQGYLRITDRKKDMFIMGGFNAYPAEIENLMLSHPDIAQVAVVGVPDEKFGEVGAAFVIPKPSQTQLLEQDLTQWCRQNMANYKVPRHIRFVDVLPLNASGKVLKYELREQFG